MKISFKVLKPCQVVNSRPCKIMASVLKLIKSVTRSKQLLEFFFWNLIMGICLYRKLPVFPSRLGTFFTVKIQSSSLVPLLRIIIAKLAGIIHRIRDICGEKSQVWLRSLQMPLKFTFVKVESDKRILHREDARTTYLVIKYLKFDFLLKLKIEYKSNKLEIINKMSRKGY